MEEQEAKTGCTPTDGSSENYTTLEQASGRYGLSRRTLNVCRNIGALTVADVLKLTKEQVMQQRNAGTKTWSQISNMQHLCGVETPQGALPDGTESGFPEPDDLFAQAVAQALAYMEAQGGNPAMTALAGSPGAFADGYADARRWAADVLPRFAADTLDGLLANYRWLRRLLEVLAESLRPQIGLPRPQMSARKAEMEQFFLAQIAGLLTPALRELVQMRVNELFAALTNRSQHGFAPLRDVSELLPYLYMGRPLNMRAFKKVGAKSRVEIEGYLARAASEITRALRGREDLSPEELAEQTRRQTRDLTARQLQAQFPHLTADEAAMLAADKTAGRPLADFFVAATYLRRSPSKALQAQCAFYGLHATRPRMTLGEIAQWLDVTPERARQMTVQSVRRSKAMDAVAQSVLARLRGAMVYSATDRVWADIARDNHLEEMAPEQLMGIAAVMGDDYTVVDLGRGVPPFLIAAPLLQGVKLRTALTDVQRRVNLQHMQPVEVDLTAILRGQSRKDCALVSDATAATAGPEAAEPGYRPGAFHPRLVELTRVVYDYFADNDLFVPLPGGRARLLPNKVDVTRGVEEIMEQKKVTMTSQQLFTLFYARYPEAQKYDFGTFKIFLAKSDRIKALGRTGRYTLKEWAGVFVGNVTQYLAHLLEQAPGTMTIKELTQKAVELFPRTNSNSVNSLMHVDPRGRFRFFAGSRVGLAGRDYADEPEVAGRPLPKGRRSSADRLEELRAFVDEHRRWPFSGGSRQEQTLLRWIYNMRMGHLSAAASERLPELDAYLDSIRHLPRTLREQRALERRAQAGSETAEK